MTDQNGTLIDQGFDDLNRLVARDLTLASGVGGDTAGDFAYDALGRLTSATDDDSTVQFTYDSLSRILTETTGPNPLGSSGRTATSAWDAENRRTKLTYPSAFEARETRDALGRVTEIKDASNTSIAAWDLYGASLRTKKTTFGNGTTANLAWDGFRRPTEIAHKTSVASEFAGFVYAWDKNDNPLYEKRSHKSGTGDVYSYDQADRLTRCLSACADPAAEIATPGSQSYTSKLDYNMDDVLNLTSYVATPYGGSSTTTNYTANAMNEYTAVGGTTHVYTDAGSLKDDGTHLYKYDGFEHLLEVRVKATNALVASYTYDALGLGRRIGKTVGSKTTRFVHAGDQVIEERDGSSGNLDRLYVFGERIDQIVAMEAPDIADVDQDSNTTELKRFHFHSQLIGSVTHVTGPNEAVVESYEYDPYGKITIKDRTSSTVTSSAIGNPYTYTGREYDSETGLYHYRARSYSPELRRFIQRDPKEYVDGPNALGYVTGRPAVSADPFGLECPRYQEPKMAPASEPLGPEIETARTPEGNKVAVIRYVAKKRKKKKKSTAAGSGSGGGGSADDDEDDPEANLAAAMAAWDEFLERIERERERRRRRNVDQPVDDDPPGEWPLPPMGTEPFSPPTGIGGPMGGGGTTTGCGQGPGPVAPGSGGCVPGATFGALVVPFRSGDGDQRLFAHECGHVDIGFQVLAQVGYLCGTASVKLTPNGVVDLVDVATSTAHKLYDAPENSGHVSPPAEGDPARYAAEGVARARE